MNQQKIDNYMMRIAELTAEMSKCEKMQVGAVFAKDGRPIATGWNGKIEGAKDDCCEYQLEDGSLKTYDDVIHAEMNALRYMVREGLSSKGCTLYITHMPCINCSKHLSGIGLERIVYLNEYIDISGVNYLKEHNIKIEKLEK